MNKCLMHSVHILKCIICINKQNSASINLVNKNLSVSYTIVEVNASNQWLNNLITYHYLIS